jgi:BirA family biotin operon repressor/biotin-[acetyl-CoA-carboxylase] ligase
MTDVRWFDEVDSTNRVALSLAAPGLVVVADHQTAGRGRFDRRWEAPAGTSLLVSVVIGDPLPTVAVALAAARACEDIAAVAPDLKWPNDLIVGERKLGGVLGERAGADGDQVVGLGLNVNWGRVAGGPPAGGVSLDEIVGRPVDRLALLAAFLRRLASPPDDLLDAYRRRCATLGRRVRVEIGGEVVESVAIGVSAEGHLLLEGGWVIAAGDVTHVRPCP